MVAQCLCYQITGPHYNENVEVPKYNQNATLPFAL